MLAVKVARHMVVGPYFFEARGDVAAGLGGKRTPGVKDAAGRRVDSGRGVSHDAKLSLLVFHVGSGVGMLAIKACV